MINVSKSVNLTNQSFRMPAITERIDNEDRLSGGGGGDSTEIKRVAFNRSVSDYYEVQNKPNKNDDGDDSEYSDDEVGSRLNSANKRKPYDRKVNTSMASIKRRKGSNKPPLAKNNKKPPLLL